MAIYERAATPEGSCTDVFSGPESFRTAHTEPVANAVIQGSLRVR